METMDDLKAEARKINAKISRIEHDNRAAENKSHVGKCFKYRNCYSCPEKPSDYWWLYIRVTGLLKDGSVECTEFQTDKYGEVTVKAKKQMYLVRDGCRPISKSEFDRAWKRTQERIKAMDPR